MHCAEARVTTQLKNEQQIPKNVDDPPSLQKYVCGLIYISPPRPLTDNIYCIDGSACNSVAFRGGHKLRVEVWVNNDPGRTILVHFYNPTTGGYIKPETFSSLGSWHAGEESTFSVCTY